MRRLGVLIDAVFNHRPIGRLPAAIRPRTCRRPSNRGGRHRIAGADSDEVRHYIIDCAWMRDFHARRLAVGRRACAVDTAMHPRGLANATAGCPGARLGRPLSLIETDRSG